MITLICTAGLAFGAGALGWDLWNEATRYVRVGRQGRE